MSRWVKVQLKITDRSCLIGALEKLGYKINLNSEKLVSGEQYGIFDQVNVVCTNQKGQVIGFSKNKENYYEMSYYDIDTSFVDQIVQEHGALKAIKETNQMGYTVMSRKVNSEDEIEIEVMLS